MEKMSMSWEDKKTLDDKLANWRDCMINGELLNNAQMKSWWFQHQSDYGKEIDTLKKAVPIDTKELARKNYWLKLMLEEIRRLAEAENDPNEPNNSRCGLTAPARPDDR